MTDRAPSEKSSDLVASIGDVFWFVDQALEAMIAIVGDLGDVLANRRPELEGANSSYAILTHCVGVMEYWGGVRIAGRRIDRDRDAEFRAQGQVAGLIGRTRQARQQLERDLVALDPRAEPLGGDPGAGAESPYAKTQGAVVLHVLEELLQHLGQMELTRDIVCAAARSAPRD